MKTLGDIISDYRKKYDITMSKFAATSGLSKGYISMLEKNYNPISKKKIIPTIDTINKVAVAMNLTFDELFNQLDDQLVSVGVEGLQELPVSNIVFDDYFPLHYCSNLSAGTFQELLDAEPDAVVYVPIKFQNRKKRLKAFKVNGTSMNNLFPNGAVVVTEDNLNNAINYKDGTPVVVLMNNEATVKRIYNQDERLLLVPDSTDKTHLPVAILKDDSQVYVIGKVIYHINPDDIEKYY